MQTTCPPPPRNGWRACIRPDRSPHDEEAFERWRPADADHAAAYAEVEYLHQQAARLANDPLLRAVARAARRDLAQRTAAGPQRTWLLVAGMAASLLLAFGLVWVAGGGHATEQHYASSVGLPQSIDPEPTAPRCNWMRSRAWSPDSVRNSARSCCCMAVPSSRSPTRPCVRSWCRSTAARSATSAPPSRSAGSAGGVTVGLLQGGSRSAATRAASAGAASCVRPSRLHIDADGKAGAVTALDLAQATGWTHGELTFRERRLDDLVEAMNRYSHHPAPPRRSLRWPRSRSAAISMPATRTRWSRRWPAAGNCAHERTGADELTLLPAAGPR